MFFKLISDSSDRQALAITPAIQNEKKTFQLDPNTRKGVMPIGSEGPLNPRRGQSFVSSYYLHSITDTI